MHTTVAVDMAHYNRWMNSRLYELCAGLDDEARKADRGLFFRSIHGTLNHLLLADKVWVGRFLEQPFQVESLDQELHADFAELRSAREQADEEIIDWACSLTEDGLNGILKYRGLADGKKKRLETGVLVTHFFNHQTHHRGQLTAVLGQMGLDYGVTDLIALPEVLKRMED